MYTRHALHGARRVAMCSETRQHTRISRVTHEEREDDTTHVLDDGEYDAVVLDGDLLQLRADGAFNLTTRSGADGGAYDIHDGDFGVTTSSCRTARDRYRVQVTGRRARNQDVLQLSLVDDECRARRDSLVGDRW